MANMKAAISELADIVEHLVATHVHWNMDLSHAEAVVKVAAAKAHLVSEDVSAVTDDVESGDATAVVQDGTKTVGDVVSMVKTSE